MKCQFIARKCSSLTTVLMLTAPIFITPALAVNAVKQSIESSTPAKVLQNNQGEYLLAQYSNNCRRVMARSGIFVWQKPTVDSQIVRFLDYGTNVNIRNRGKNGWTPISSPVNGYILHSNFLTSCQASKVATPPELNFCRKVAADGGLVVRASPSNNSARVGVVPNGQNVAIDRGKNGWVPILSPVAGYAQSRYLAYCPRTQ